jgi:hypothetical protein
MARTDVFIVGWIVGLMHGVLLVAFIRAYKEWRIRK